MLTTVTTKENDWRGHGHWRWRSACSSVSTTHCLIYFFLLNR